MQYEFHNQHMKSMQIVNSLIYSMFKFMCQQKILKVLSLLCIVKGLANSTCKNIDLLSDQTILSNWI